MIYNLKLILMDLAQVGLGMVAVYAIFDFLSKFGRTLYYKKYIYVLTYLAYFLTLILTGAISATLNLAVSMIGLVIIGHFLYNNSKVYILYYCTYILFIGCFRLLVDNIIIHTKLRELAYYSKMDVIIIIFAFIIMSKLFILFFQRKKIKEITTTQYLTFLFLILFGIIYLTPLVVLAERYDSPFEKSFLITNAIIVILLIIYISNILESISKSNIIKNEFDLYEQQANLQYKYYNDLENKYRNSRKVIHDMKNHLQSIEKLYELKENDAAKKYTDDVYEMLKELGYKYYSSNKVLNIVINDKVQNAESKNINIQCEIGDVCLDFIKDIDLTIIITNLLDNAIEAARKVDNNSYIKLKINKFNDFVVIRLINSIKNIPDEIEKGIFKSNKEKHQGIGLINVEKVLKKYDGNLRINYDEKIFKVNMVIPAKEEKG